LLLLKAKDKDTQNGSHRHSNAIAVNVPM
jgi:hypothetical protein